MIKQQLEERQRSKANDRRAQNEEWKPRFFTGALTPVGRPDLSLEGKEALRKLQQGDYRLEPSAVTGA